MLILVPSLPKARKYIIKLGYFVAPKVYSFIDYKFNNVVKIKGFKNSLFFYELNFVLYKDTVLKRTHEKWYRNWTEGNILIKKELYSLMVTGNKRQLIFDSYQKLVDTRPYIIDEGIILNNNIDYIYNLTAPNFKNKLIYLHRYYSVLVEDPVTNIYCIINIKASNLLELYLENREIINQKII